MALSTPYNPALAAYNANQQNQANINRQFVSPRAMRSTSSLRSVAPSSPSLPAFNAAPSPVGGRGAYGSVPGPVAVPPSIWQQMASVNPAQQQQASAISGNISNQIAGQLSPNTINAIRDNAASFGVMSGMPGSQFAGYRGLRNLGLAVEGQQQQGLNNYLSFLTGVGGTQTNPNLAYQVADRNAAMASLPDPAARAAEEERIWQRHFSQMQPLGFGGGGGGSRLPWVNRTSTLGPSASYAAPSTPSGGTLPHFQEYGSTPIVGALGPFDEEPGAGDYQVPMLDYYGNTYGGGGDEDVSSYFESYLSELGY